jgi:hypothetical protein
MAAAMGDPRNKVHRIERDESIMASLVEQKARDLARELAAPPVRCQCGHTWHDRTIYALPGAHLDPPRFGCRDCAPPELRHLMVE